MGTQSFTTKELNHATNGFSEEYKIGEGAFGEVFRGFLKRTHCAIKRLFSVSIFNNLIINTESFGRHSAIERLFSGSFCNAANQLQVHVLNGDSSVSCSYLLTLPH